MSAMTCDPGDSFRSPDLFAPPGLFQLLLQTKHFRHSTGRSTERSKPFFAFFRPRIAFNFFGHPDCQIYSLVNRPKTLFCCALMTDSLVFKDFFSRRLGGWNLRVPTKLQL
jgi:hypothetical protein